MHAEQRGHWVSEWAINREHSHLINMPSNHSNLQSPFVPLSDVLREAATRVPVSDEDADIRRGMNRPALSSDPLMAQLELAPIKVLLGQARAARALLAKLNRPSTERPHWADVSSGYPLLDDSVSGDGLKFLVTIERYEMESLPRGGIKHGSLSAEVSAERERLAQRSMQIGFMRGDLSRLLDVPVEHEETVAPPVVDDRVEQEKAAALDIEEYVRRMSHLILTRATKVSIRREIVQALQHAVNPDQLASVWDALNKLAKERKFASLTWVDDTLIRVPGGKTGISDYRKARLKTFLERYDKILKDEAIATKSGRK